MLKYLLILAVIASWIFFLSPIVSALLTNLGIYLNPVATYIVIPFVCLLVAVFCWQIIQIFK